MDFLAEVLLEKGFSLTYKEFNGVQALAAASEESVNRLYLFLKPEEVKEKLKGWVPRQESFRVIIPVLRTDDELKVRAELKEAGRDGAEVYRLNLVERFAFYSRGFKKEQELQPFRHNTVSPIV